MEVINFYSKGEDTMKKLFILLVILGLMMPVSVMAGSNEAPMKLPAGSPVDAIKHNQEGIAHYLQGHLDVSLQHFNLAEKNGPKIGEIHFNKGLVLDKLGKHGAASMHFKIAKENANGNKHILISPILNAHIR